MDLQRRYEPYVQRYGRHISRAYRAYRRYSPYARPVYGALSRVYSSIPKQGPYTQSGKGPGRKKTVYTSRNGPTTQVSSAGKKRKRRGKSLKSRVRKLEVNKPPLSHYTTHYVTPVVMKTLTANSQRKIIYWQPGLNHQEIETEMKAVEFPTANVDLTLKNTQVPLTRHSLWIVKNSGLSAIIIKYTIASCVDDDNESPLDEIRSKCLDRGYTGLNAVSTRIPAVSGVNSETPVRWILDQTNNHMEVMSYMSTGPDKKWDTSPYKTLVLQPGDRINIVHSPKLKKYEPEVFDREPFTYLSGIDYGLVLQVIGEIAHGDTPGTSDIVGRMDHYIDCIRHDTVTLSVDNGLGLRKNVNKNTLDNTGIVNYVQAGANNVIQGDL